MTDHGHGYDFCLCDLQRALLAGFIAGVVAALCFATALWWVIA